jgi:MerR family copper efflux transcriptional regulator
MPVTVGAAAAAAGVSAKSVRLWESKDLLPRTERSRAGYRLFTDEDIDVLRFIRRAKPLNLTLAEIKGIIDLQRDGGTPCAHVTTLLDAHIAGLDRTLSELKALRRSLAQARQAARESRDRGDDAVICRIIEAGSDKP